MPTAKQTAPQANRQNDACVEGRGGQAAAPLHEPVPPPNQAEQNPAERQGQAERSLALRAERRGSAERAVEQNQAVKDQALSDLLLIFATLLRLPTKEVVSCLADGTLAGDLKESCCLLGMMSGTAPEATQIKEGFAQLAKAGLRQTGTPAELAAAGEAGEETTLAKAALAQAGSAATLVKIELAAAGEAGEADEEAQAQAQLTALRCAYTALFTHPERPLVPPYESTFLFFEAHPDVSLKEAPPLFICPAALSAERIYKLAGLKRSSGINESADHLATELEFVSALLGKRSACLAHRSPEELAEATRIDEVLGEFTQAHLSKWAIAAFDQLARTTAHPLYTALGLIGGVAMARALKTSNSR